MCDWLNIGCLYLYLNYRYMSRYWEEAIGSWVQQPVASLGFFQAPIQNMVFWNQFFCSLYCICFGSLCFELNYVQSHDLYVSFILIFLLLFSLRAVNQRNWSNYGAARSIHGTGNYFLLPYSYVLEGWWK